MKNTDFSSRMSLIVGQRGVGKTTLLIQVLLDKAQKNLLDEIEHGNKQRIPL